MTSQAEKIRESFKNHKWEPSRHFMDFIFPASANIVAWNFFNR